MALPAVLLVMVAWATPPAVGNTPETEPRVVENWTTEPLGTGLPFCSHCSCTTCPVLRMTSEFGAGAMKAKESPEMLTSAVAVMPMAVAVTVSPPPEPAVPAVSVPSALPEALVVRVGGLTTLPLAEVNATEIPLMPAPAESFSDAVN